MINIEKKEFLETFEYKDDFSYELFKHFIYCGVEDEEIEDWLWNPFDFDDPNFILSFPDDHTNQTNEIDYEDAITFKRINNMFGRDKKIKILLND